MTGFQWFLLAKAMLSMGAAASAYQWGRPQLMWLMFLYATADLVLAFVPTEMGG